jgi:hypothetical protein
MSAKVFDRVLPFSKTVVGRRTHNSCTSLARMLMVSVRVFDLDHRRVGVDSLARFRDLPSIRCVGVGHDDYPVTEARTRARWLPARHTSAKPKVSHSQSTALPTSS